MQRAFITEVVSREEGILKKRLEKVNKIAIFLNLESSIRVAQKR